MCQDDVERPQIHYSSYTILETAAIFLLHHEQAFLSSPYLESSLLLSITSYLNLALGLDAPLLQSISQGAWAIDLGLTAHSVQGSFLSLAWMLSIIGQFVKG